MSVKRLGPGEALPEGFSVIPTEDEPEYMYTPASEVKITRADGTVEVRASYTGAELRAIIGSRKGRPAKTA